MVLSYSHIECDVKVIVCVSPLITFFSSASPLLPPSQWGAFMRRLAKKIGAEKVELMCRTIGISYKCENTGRRNADHSGGFTSSGGFGGFGGSSSFGASSFGDQSFGASSSYGGAAVSACNTVYEEECSTSYEQECSTEYEQQCNTVFK